MTFNNNSKILITGGTGSFGKAFLEEVLKRYPAIDRIVIFSRDELKQWEMQQLYPKSKYPQIRFFIGDIRDRDRLSLALEQIDTVIHAAALKQVPAAEYNPIEFIKTNVIGAENLVRASLNGDVKRIVALSTDKAAAPINLYGASKLCSDKLFIAANNMKGSRDLKISVVRYGNVLGSRGSVVPFFLEQAKNGIIPITHEEMTRFNITLQEGVNMVLNSLEKSIGGELFVPKIPSYRILDIAKAIAPKCELKKIGIRPGEKIHEEMITAADSCNTYDLGTNYVILPNNEYTIKKFKENNVSAKKVIEGFSYNSFNNEDYLTIQEIRSLIKKHIDANFKIN